MLSEGVSTRVAVLTSRIRINSLVGANPASKVSTATRFALARVTCPDNCSSGATRSKQQKSHGIFDDLELILLGLLGISYSGLSNFALRIFLTDACNEFVFFLYPSKGFWSILCTFRTLCLVVLLVELHDEHTQLSSHTTRT